MPSTPRSDPLFLEIPRSYTNLPVQHIKISQYPESALEPTPVIIVTLDRPKQRNASIEQMMKVLELCYPIFDLDERVKACSLDLVTPSASAPISTSASSLPEKQGEYSITETAVASKPRHLSVPDMYHCGDEWTCCGTGMTMTLAAAIRIAHSSSKYGFVFARHGITMESNSSYLLLRLVGYSTTTYLLTTADVIPGNSKYFAQLFHEVFDDKAAILPRALELATNIAGNVSVLAAHLNKGLMWRGPNSIEESHLLDSSVLWHMFANSVFRGGSEKFL